MYRNFFFAAALLAAAFSGRPRPMALTIFSGQSGERQSMLTRPAALLRVPNPLAGKGVVDRSPAAIRCVKRESRQTH